MQSCLLAVYLTPHIHHITEHKIERPAKTAKLGRGQNQAPSPDLYFTSALEGSLSLLFHHCPNPPKTHPAQKLPRELPDRGEQHSCRSSRAALKGPGRGFPWQHGPRLQEDLEPQAGPGATSRPWKPSIRSLSSIRSRAIRRTYLFSGLFSLFPEPRRPPRIIR